VEAEESVVIETAPQPTDLSLSLTHPNSLIFAFVVFAGMVTVGLGMSGSKSSGSTAWESVTPAVSKPSRPDPSEKVRPIFEKMATSVAPIAIRASLIPRNLLDRERMERQIRGELENQLGDGWTVEATCYAGWCNIKLIHAVGEIWIDADEGIATKSIYLN
jgi:hypothetical protein